MRTHAPKKEFLLLSERLNALTDFKLLSDNERRICLEHVCFPSLTKEELGKKLSIPKNEVYVFFHSTRWELINTELAKQQIRELIQLAIATLRDCMINGKGTAQLNSAIAVLTNADLIRTQPKSVRQDNKILVVWNDKDKLEINGSQDSLLPAPQAEGDTRV